MRSMPGKPMNWRKATASNPSGNCVELAPVGDEIYVRDSKNPGDLPLVFTRAEMAAFVHGVKAGEFDSFVS